MVEILQNFAAFSEYMNFFFELKIYKVDVKIVNRRQQTPSSQIFRTELSVNLLLP